MHRNQSVDVHQFAMVPRADIPRSSFRMQKGVKATFDAGFLVPVVCEEILPGDTFNLRMTCFARLATPIFPFMDNMYLESFFFFVPNRLVWDNFVKMMGEQKNPGDSISFTVPQVVSPVAGYPIGSVFDHFGLPTVGQVGAGNTVSTSCLPLRGYNLIYNEWFRDENLVTPAGPLPFDKGDGPDIETEFVLLRRGKRHDYFTSALPWVQKGTTSVSIPLGTSAPIKTSTSALVSGPQTEMRLRETDGSDPPGGMAMVTGGADSAFQVSTTSAVSASFSLYPENLYADLSAATAATINQLRQSFQIQRLLERDARGGTRYTEHVRSHFGVVSPDARLQRPEYLGGGRTPVSVNPIAQTSATGLTGGSTPVGNLAAFGTVLAQGHGFSQSFTEHGYVIGVVCVRADLTYQQGLRRHWSRSTRYDFYHPVFQALGEQAILNKEIYCDGSATDALVFGYQARWDEYRYNPSEIHGLFRSTATGTLDAWHLAQRFTAVPTLNNTFISEFPPIARVIAVPTAPHFLADFFLDVKAARPMPLYSVPGMIDHF